MQILSLHGANVTNSSTALTVSSVTDSKQAILPVILVEILGSENVKKQGNLLLDSGAQFSLIKLSEAEELGLKGKEVTITIAKVGGEEEELITNLFRVRIRSLVSRNVILTVTAVSIPCISSDITEIKLSHVAGIFGLGEEEIREEMARLTYSLALITLNCIQVRPEKLLTLLQDSPPLAGSYLEPHPENMNN